MYVAEMGPEHNLVGIANYQPAATRRHGTGRCCMTAIQHIQSHRMLEVSCLGWVAGQCYLEQLDEIAGPVVPEPVENDL